MLARFFRYLVVGTLGCLTLTAASTRFGFAQSDPAEIIKHLVAAGDRGTVGFALREPDYTDSSQVGRYAAFLMVSIMLFKNILDGDRPNSCRLMGLSIQFPDLLISKDAEMRQHRQ